jgi:hypothetical protein
MGKNIRLKLAQTIHKPVEKEFSVRALEISDNKKGFVELIGQLSPTCPLSEEEFQVCFAATSLVFLSNFAGLYYSSRLNRNLVDLAPESTESFLH